MVRTRPQCESDAMGLTGRLRLIRGDVLVQEAARHYKSWGRVSE